jgi:serine phosphatase RsbU (regulator of sigma subunit)
VSTVARESELRSIGSPLWARFTLFMTLSLALVMAAMMFFLYSTSARIIKGVRQQALIDTVEVMAEANQFELDSARLLAERDALLALERKLVERDAAPGVAELLVDLRKLKVENEQKRSQLAGKRIEWKQEGSTVQAFEGSRVKAVDMRFGPDNRAGTVYQVDLGEGRGTYELLVPGSAGRAEKGLLGLMIGTTILVILVGAAVSVLVANTVSGPIEKIVADVRQISTGDLRHKVHAAGGGELTLLGRSIDRMTKSLAEAQDAKLELSIREREIEVAGEVRESILPQRTPQIPGFQIGAVHLSSNELCGDFHDFVEFPSSGRVGLVVCDVSGKGVPGTLVGVTARTWLRSLLSEGKDVKATFQRINRELARDVRKGMYVSALYVLLDRGASSVTVVCAGHKIPLVRFTAADGKVRLVQPEGIALAFDKGPIFDSRLQVVDVPLDAGDRLVLATSGAVSVANAEGHELGEKPFFALVQKHGAQPTEAFLSKLKVALENHAAGADLSRDVSIVTVARA